MRTTLNIDMDVLLAAKAIAAYEERSLGAVISALARDSLPRGLPAPAGQCAHRGAGRFAVLPAREEAVTVEHVRCLLDA